MKILIQALILSWFIPQFCFADEYPDRPKNDVQFLGIESYRDVRMHNWAENVIFQPELIFYPKNQNDLVKIVNSARNSGKKITIIGRGHSWNPLMKGVDYLVSTLDMNAVYVNTENKTVIAEGGASIGKIDQALRANGLAIPCNIIGATEITIGGIVATGSHGSGRSCRTMSDYVESIELVKADGSVEEISDASHGSEYMNALKLNLGMFGIMSKITLRVENDFNVEVHDRQFPLKKLMKKLPQILEEQSAVEVLWIPFTENVLIKSWSKTSKAIKPETDWDRRNEALRKDTLEFFYEHFLSPAIKKWPSSIVQINKSLGPLRFPERRTVTDVAKAVHYVNEGSRFPINETELALPIINNDLSDVEAGWNAMTDAVGYFKAKDQYPLNVVVHMRFITGSDATISPSLGNQMTCYMDFGSYSGSPGWKELTNHIWKTWSKLPGGKLHWAKDMIAYDNLDIFKMYGEENIAKFLSAQKRTDPQGMFVNDFLKNLFTRK